jgi:hypothetical protein
MTMIDFNYTTVCQRLGFSPEAKFVKVHDDGSISYTCGKPDEIKALYHRCRQRGFRIHKDLTEAARQVYGPGGYMDESE